MSFRIFRSSSARTDQLLERLFVGTDRIFRSIDVLPFPSAEKPLLWTATTHILATPPKDVNPAIMAWGGTGTDFDIRIARTKSVSEAYERWALRISGIAQLEQFGFSFDSSSTGVAAYPFRPDLARKAALREATERYVFSRLNLQPINMNPKEITTFNKLQGLPAVIKVFAADRPKERVNFYQVSAPCFPEKVFLCRWSLQDGRMVAGFACEKSEMNAKLKSLVEAYRHRQILERLRGRDRVVSRTEQTLLYWATEANPTEIEDWFERRIQSREAIVTLPKLMVDCELPAPHGDLIALWRCYFEGTLPSHECPEDYLYY